VSPGDEFTLSQTTNDAKTAIPMDYEQRVIIKFLSNDGLEAHQIAEKLKAQFSEGAYSLSAVQFWMAEVQRGREDLHDEPRPGRPSSDCLSARIQEI
jgi:transposase